ncbi:hypothetical protein Tco_0609177 [Tanacetum coccineum]
MQKYWSHSTVFSTALSSQKWEVEVSNRGLKTYLEKDIGGKPCFWIGQNLMMPLWAFRTAYKTPIELNSLQACVWKGIAIFRSAGAQSLLGLKLSKLLIFLLRHTMEGDVQQLVVPNLKPSLLSNKFMVTESSIADLKQAIARIVKASGFVLFDPAELQKSSASFWES